jgi:hypothetical protein
MFKLTKAITQSEHERMLRVINNFEYESMVIVKRYLDRYFSEGWILSYSLRKDLLVIEWDTGRDISGVTDLKKVEFIKPDRQPKSDPRPFSKKNEKINAVKDRLIAKPAWDETDNSMHFIDPKRAISKQEKIHDCYDPIIEKIKLGTKKNEGMVMPTFYIYWEEIPIPMTPQY